MKTRLTLVSALLVAAPAIFAHEGEDRSKPAEKSAATPGYPLTTCVVSGDDLDNMGKPIEYRYQQAGQPDRLVLFCCKDCVKDFAKDPAKYLAKLDAAPAAKAKPAPKS